MKNEGDFLEIYLDDFKEDVQKDILKALKLESEVDGNYDTFPIATIPIPEEEEINPFEEIRNPKNRLKIGDMNKKEHQTEICKILFPYELTGEENSTLYTSNLK